MTKTNELKSINGLNFFGSKFESFLKPSKTKEKIECWVKIYMNVLYFYMNPKNKNHTFFVSTTNIRNKLNNLGNTYHYKTVQKSIRKIELMGLATVSRTPLYDNKTNEFCGIKREIKLDMKKAYQILSVLDEDDPFFKSLKDKDCLKKVIRKRPFVLSTALPNALEIAEKLGKVFNDTKEVLAYYVYKVSSRYLNTREFFNTYKPSFLKNELDDIDDSYSKNNKIDVNPKLLTTDDYFNLKDLYDKKSKKFYKVVNKIKGYEIDSKLEKLYEEMKIYVVGGKIKGYFNNNGELIADNINGGFNEI